MIVIRQRNFSQNKILNTNLPGLGFIKGRKYDTDLDRLGRMKTSSRELSKVGELGKEGRKLATELNRGISIKDLKD